MRALPDLGVESRRARIRLQLPPAEHAAGLGIPEAARAVRTSPGRARRQAAELCQRAVAHDGRRAAGSPGPRRGCEKPGRYGVCGSGDGGGADGVTKEIETLPRRTRKRTEDTENVVGRDLC